MGLAFSFYKNATFVDAWVIVALIVLMNFLLISEIPMFSLKFKTFNFAESENRWVNYAPFTIEIEFNEIDFKGCDGNSPIDCNSSIFHANPNSNNLVADKLIDIQKYKIKTFNDKWNISIEDSIYQEHIGTSNSTFRVSYDIYYLLSKYSTYH